MRKPTLLWLLAIVVVPAWAASPVRPDLSGTYDTATLTPLQRPAAFGNSLFMTPEVAARIAQRSAEFRTSEDEDSDPNREAPPAGGDGSDGAAGNVGGYNAFWIDNGSAATAVDGTFRTSIITHPANGRLPPYTPAARAANQRLFAEFTRRNTGRAWWLDEGNGSGPFDDMEQRGVGERCLLGFGSTGGPPMLPVLYNNLKRIVQTDTHVLILVEMVHDVRIVRMNGTHPPKHVRRWLGDSIGHWEGDTLVIDTTNFHPQGGFRGATDTTRVTERLRRNADGSLHYAFTVEDPAIWVEAWRGEYTWPRTSEKLYEYACHEANYSLTNVMRGARQLEQDALAERRRGSRDTDETDAASPATP